jgi:ribosomal protein S12 methylthiotransferase accessory factor
MHLFGTEQTARKQFFRGTHRVRSPEDTLADYARFMPRMGITRLANVTGLDRIGLPVCVAVRPNSRALSTSQGKGETLAAAKVSALMESIESWHGERIDHPVRVASYRELAQDALVARPADLPLRADAHWADERPIEWIAGEDLLSGRPCWLPLDTVTTNFVDAPGRQPLFLRSTNGLASGNHPLEAVVHALFEVIERDALTLWSLRSEADRRAGWVDPATVTDGPLQAVFATLHDKGIRMLLEDVTSDLGVPTYSCTLVDDPASAHWRAIPKIVGHGCHFDPVVALSRAVHEAIQSRVTVIAGSRDDLFPRDYQNAAGREDHARLVEDARQAKRPFREPDAEPLPTFEADLQRLLAVLRDHGVPQVAAVNLQRADIGIPVVKVVVPGLEPVRTPWWQPGPRARHAMGATTTAASAAAVASQADRRHTQEVNA